MSEKRIALELRGVTKTFGEVVANKNVDLTLHHGEILAILGENGSGKTTLMNMIAGIYYPDEGHIYVDGEEANIRSPKDAFAYGVGMIHQHFKLVDVFSAADNIILGINDGTKYNKNCKKTRLRLISGYPCPPAASHQQGRNYRRASFSNRNRGVGPCSGRRCSKGISGLGRRCARNRKIHPYAANM